MVNVLSAKVCESSRYSTLRFAKLQIYLITNLATCNTQLDHVSASRVHAKIHATVGFYGPVK